MADLILELKRMAEQMEFRVLAGVLRLAYAEARRLRRARGS
jgi:hypothetical protein